MGVGSSISIYQSDVEAAAAAGIISEEQATALWPNLEQSYNNRWRLTWIRLAYAFGAFLIIGSLTWFTDLAWQDSKGLALFYLSSAYVLSFGYAGYYFWNNKNQYIPQIVGGIFASISVALAPVITYSLQRYFNFWFYNAFQYLPQELTELVAGFIGIYLVPFPVITAHICLAIYSIIGNNLTEMVFGPNPTVAQYSWVAIVAGGVVLAGSVLVDRKFGYDFSFFPYLLGVGVFWGGWTWLYYYPIYTSKVFQVTYLIVNLILVGSGVWIQRLVFSLFGSLGTVYFIADQLYAHGSVENNAWAAIIFGTILTGIAYYVALKQPQSEFPFWAYLVSVSIFWGGWTTLYEYPIYTSQLFKFLYFLVNVGLMVATIPFKQRVFFYWGLLGAFIYITDMVEIYWSNSWYLPFILTLIGLGFIALAIYFSNHPGPGWWQRFRRNRSNKNNANTAPEDVVPLLETANNPPIFVLINSQTA